MSILFAVVFIIFFDRILPANVWRLGNQAFSVTLNELYEKYGFFKLPRGIFAILFCLSFSVELFFPVKKEFQGVVSIFIFVFYVLFAFIDVWRARK
jgi:hypothetical protein